MDERMDAARLTGEVRGRGARESQEAAVREIIRDSPFPTLHPTKVFFLRDKLPPGLFQHKKPRLANTGKNYRTCNRPNDTWKTGGETVWQTQHHLVASAGNGDQIYG